MIRSTPSGVEIDVRVIPRAGRNEIAGTRADAWLVRVGAPPLENAANDAVINLLSRLLRVPATAIRIVGGARSRQKRIAIAGMGVEEVRGILGG